MGRALWLADVLADAFRGVRGFRVETWPGWTTAGKASFEPIGCMDHHTGGGGTLDNVVRYMMAVSSIAPSCNYATGPPVNGVVRIIVTCAGRANHAGRGRLPWIPANHGNFRTLGGEHHNNGRAPWPGQQLEAVRRIDAAVLDYLGQGVDRVVFHKTYTDRKYDMHSLSLVAHRNAIRDVGAPPPPPPPRHQEDDQMYADLIHAAYRRTRHNEGDEPHPRLPGGYVSTYDVAVSDPQGWRSWLEQLAKADVQRRDVPSAKLDVVRNCETLLAREAGL